MKIQIIESAESDGNWYKVYLDGNLQSCHKKDTTYRSNEDALHEAERVFNFILENGANQKVIKEYNFS